MRAITALFGLSLLQLHAATLEHLSLDDMATKSTAIVRGRVQSCAGEFRGSVIYTHCKVVVSEQWKGTSLPVVDVAVPGGISRGMVQSFAGTPNLGIGQEYVLFLWTGKSGMTQVIGLSQGVFDLKSDTKGQSVAQRGATSERMLDSTGREIQDSAVQMRVRELKQRVAKALASETEGRK
jgi:hypothetical protein